MLTPVFDDFVSLSKHASVLLSVIVDSNTSAERVFHGTLRILRAWGCGRSARMPFFSMLAVAVSSCSKDMPSLNINVICQAGLILGGLSLTAGDLSK